MSNRSTFINKKVTNQDIYDKQESMEKKLDQALSKIKLVRLIASTALTLAVLAIGMVAGG